MATATAAKKATKKPNQGVAWARQIGKPIEDAWQPLQIRLTSADIKKGRRKDQTGCAFACGIKRQEDAMNAWVGRTFVFVEWYDKILRYQVPASVGIEIASFDRSRMAAAGEFHLRPPSPSMRLGAKRKPAGKTKGSGTRPNQHRTAMVRAG